jgi:2-polyprenyl-6-methoxyphenol hydroxylase-like FAD-dependent oxidoreductase
MAPNCRIAIVGGGLAGLATAQALKSFSIKAEVFEAAPALGEIGAAVNTSPQAVKALRAIGVGDGIVAVGHQSTGIYTRNMLTGEFLEFNDRVKLAERFGAPYYSFHRADLLNALASGLEPSAIHLAHRLTGIEEREERIILNFANGIRFEFEYVIGADGVRSALRRALYGADNPTYTGQMVWRSLLNAGDIPQETLDPTGHTQWVGPGRHLLAYEIRQGKLVNIVTQQDTAEWVEEGWSTRGDPDEMRASFPNSEPRLEKLLSIVTECSKWGLFTRQLTQNWGRGRVQLIGDAAHAMLPNAGQGACQAFEDAYILARWLDAGGDPAEAFANFRRVRIPRVHGVQRLSFSNSRFKHMRDATAQKQSIAAGTGSVHGNSEWVWGYVRSTNGTGSLPFPPPTRHEQRGRH